MTDDRPCHLTGRQFKDRLKHPAVEVVENDCEGGLDDGRYMISLFLEWDIDLGSGRQTTFTVGSLAEARRVLKRAKPYAQEADQGQPIAHA